MSTAIIVSMGAATAASAIIQKILTAQGETDKASYLDLFTSSGLAVTAIGAFAKVLATLAKLG